MTLKHSTLLSSLVAGSLILCAPAHGQVLKLKMNGGGGIGQPLQVQIDGPAGSGYLLLMSTQYQQTALPAPHVSPIDIGLELLANSVGAPGFVGLTPANLNYAIPNVPSFDGAHLNFQALKITGATLSHKSNPWRLTLSEPGKSHDTLETSNFKRAFGTATALGDDTVLLAGGAPTLLPTSSAAYIFSDTIGSSTAELYHPGTESFEIVGNMAKPRSRHVATLLNDGRVLITGGTNGAQGLATAEIYNPATKAFTAVGPMVQGRVGHTATLLNDGRVWIAGGSAVGSNQAAIAANALSTSEIFDPATGTFQAAGSIFFNRSFHTATLLNDGRVVLAGGFSSSGGNNFVLSSVMVYTPNAGGGSILNMKSLTHARAGHSALLMNDGNVMIAGGMDGIYADHIAIKSCEIVDAVNNAVKYGAELGNETAFPSMVKMDNGDILVGGGMYGVGSFEQPLHLTTLWRAAFQSWFFTGNFTINRYGSSAVKLFDGTVAVFHGAFFNGLLLDSAEVYQPDL